MVIKNERHSARYHVVSIYDGRDGGSCKSLSKEIMLISSGLGAFK